MGPNRTSTLLICMVSPPEPPIPKSSRPKCLSPKTSKQQESIATLINGQRSNASTLTMTSYHYETRAYTFHPYSNGSSRPSATAARKQAISDAEQAGWKLMPSMCLNCVAVVWDLMSATDRPINLAIIGTLSDRPSRRLYITEFVAAVGTQPSFRTAHRRKF